MNGAVNDLYRFNIQIYAALINFRIFYSTLYVFIYKTIKLL